MYFVDIFRYVLALSYAPVIMPYISPRHAGGGRHVYPCECFQQIIWGLQPDDKSNFEVLENMKTHSDSGEYSRSVIYLRQKLRHSMFRCSRQHGRWPKNSMPKIALNGWIDHFLSRASPGQHRGTRLPADIHAANKSLLMTSATRLPRHVQCPARPRVTCPTTR